MLGKLAQDPKDENFEEGDLDVSYTTFFHSTSLKKKHLVRSEKYMKDTVGLILKTWTVTSYVTYVSFIYKLRNLRTEPLG